LAKEGHSGSFTFIPTPGLKRLTIKNDRYLQFVKHSETHVNVTKPGVIPDITLSYPEDLLETSAAGTERT